jgi:hypothetical protein
MEKVCDNIYPPDPALVLCVDEKSQVQALECSPPLLPMALGDVVGVTHDYYRRGGTTLFAALHIANGMASGQCKPRQRLHANSPEGDWRAGLLTQLGEGLLWLLMPPL